MCTPFGLKFINNSMERGVFKTVTNPGKFKVVAWSLTSASIRALTYSSAGLKTHQVVCRMSTGYGPAAVEVGGDLWLLYIHGIVHLCVVGGGVVVEVTKGQEEEETQE